MAKTFSMPLNVDLNEEQFEDYKNFITKNSESIYDVYFSYPMPPFEDDAVGGNRMGAASNRTIYNNLEALIAIQNDCGVKLSATFNNIYIKPNINNLKLFMQNFRLLYEMGIRSATIPFSSWIYSGEIQKAYPELFIKNTVLWRVDNAREFWNLAEVGFDYVNLDRALIRNHEILLEIHEAREAYYEKTGKRVLLSVLANEFPCAGYCPFREEHSSLASSDTHGVYFFPTFANTCLYSHMKGAKSAKNQISMNFFKMAFVHPFRREFDELDEVIDVYKMFGRIQYDYFLSTLKEVENYAAGEGLMKRLREMLEDFAEEEGSHKLINAWRRETKNCKFNCWKCHLCDQLYNSLSEKNRRELVRYKIY